MRKVYIANLYYTLRYTFLPYVDASLRNYAMRIPEINENYLWEKPIWDITTISTMADQLQNPNVLGISCYVWNFRKQLLLAKEVKSRYPDCLIVAGGPQIPDFPQVFFQQHPFVDILVHGEGEITFSEILKENLKTKPNWDTIAGVSWNDKGVCRKNIKLKKQRLDLNLPSAYAQAYVDHIVEELKDRGKKVVALWETNRGCPYSCDFCDWGSATMSKVRAYPLERLHDDIEWFARMKIDQLHNCDANFGILSRDVDLAKQLIAAKEQYNYPAAMMCSYAKRSTEKVFEIGCLMEKSRMSFGVTLSVQSMSVKVLENISRSNIGTANYKELINLYKKANVPAYSELIIGLPGETNESFVAGISELLHLGVTETLRIYPLVLLPNAKMNQKAYREKFAIEAIDRRIWAVWPMEQKIEESAEHLPIVVKTSTMSRENWVWQMTYAVLIQALQSGGFTRFLALYLTQERNISYTDLYFGLMQKHYQNESSFLGRALRKVEKRFRNLLADQNVMYLNFDQERVEFGNDAEELRCLPYHSLWLSISFARDTFYLELKEHLSSLNIVIDDCLLDLLRWQQDMVIRYEYDYEQGFKANYSYNWEDYFFRGKAIKKKANNIFYKDYTFGPGDKHLLRWKKPSEYLLAVTGGGSPYSQYYIHKQREQIL